MNSERDKQAIETTFKVGGSGTGWGWRIPYNPQRVPGKFTEKELEVSELAKNRTAQTREVSRVETYTYCAPFNYPNITVELGRAGTGCEFNPDGAELDIPPYGAITIVEKKPMVGVTVIGSGCSAKGYVILEAEPLEWKYPRTGVRMKVENLWGMHVRGDAWKTGITEDWNDAGLSSARFDIPESRKVIITGGSLGADPHYCFRIIRVDVKEASKSI